jgi:phosphonate transport system substrate-binding protein
MDIKTPDQNSNLEPINIMFFVGALNITDEIEAANTFANLLSQQTGLNVHASVNRCEAAVIEYLGTGQVDVATMSLWAYVHGNEDHGIQARLVNRRFGLPYWRSQINVAAAKGYSSIWDLQNTRFASPDPDSTSGYMVPYLMVLNETGMTPSEFFSEVSFVGSHSQVIRDVYNGMVDCGASYEDARIGVVSGYPDLYDVVSILVVSDNIPNDPWAFRSGLEESLIQNLSNGIVAVAGTPQGEAALNTILGSQGVELTQDSAYDIIRDIVAEFGYDIGSCSYFDNYLPITLMNVKQ